MSVMFPPIVIAPAGNLSRYMQEIRKYPMLKPDEEYQLSKSYLEQGDMLAANRLVTSHLRLVVKVAMGYRAYGLPVAELISEGNVGMVQAVQRFDPEKGFRLATYAMWWIKAAIQEYILHSWSLVKIGTTAAQKKLFFNLRRMKNKIQQAGEEGITPETVTEIAVKLNVTEAEVLSMNSRMAGQDHSLNAPVKVDGDGEWQDWLEDGSDNQETVLGEAEELGQRQDWLSQALSGLKDREREILKERRLNDDPTTLESLSQRFGISRERVRQIEVRAYEKVKRSVLEAAV